MKLKSVSSISAVLLFVALSAALGLHLLGRHFKDLLPTPRRECITNLRIIEAAKEHYMDDHRQGVQGTAIVSNALSFDDLAKYLPPGHEHPRCPASGQYSVGSLGVAPTCSIPDHHL